MKYGVPTNNIRAITVINHLIPPFNINKKKDKQGFLAIFELNLNAFVKFVKCKAHHLLRALVDT